MIRLEMHKVIEVSEQQASQTVESVPVQPVSAARLNVIPSQYRRHRMGVALKRATLVCPARAT